MDMLPLLFGGCCVYPGAVILTIAIWSYRRELAKRNLPALWALAALWTPILLMSLWMFYVIRYLPSD